MGVASRAEIYPEGGLGAPKDRSPGVSVDNGLPSDAEVFSADNHISLGEDIFYERAPAAMKDQMPRVSNVEGAWVVGMGERPMLPPGFTAVLEQYDPLAGSHTGDVTARLEALDSEGVDTELAFPNAVLALLHLPDRDMREACFRIYNEHIAEVQELSRQRIYGVGLINWWDADGARRTLNELVELGLKTFLLPLNAGRDDNKVPLDYSSSELDGVWDAIEEAGLPVSHHIGENPPSAPIEFNALSGGMLVSMAPFRDTFGRYIFGGVLDRHPGVRVGWFEAGLNWVPSAIQDAEHIAASFDHLNNLELEHAPQHYWDEHMMASFMVDPLGLELIDRIGVERAMWSTDFPHNESTYGYTGESLASVVEAVGADDATAIVGGNAKRFLGID